MNASQLCAIENGARCLRRTATRIAKALRKSPETVFPEFASLRVKQGGMIGGAR